MQYQNIVEGKFLDRPNRFIAHVEIAEKVETVHVKNTGRCKELLLPGVKVYLEKSGNPNRKTAYDLVAVEKAGLGLVNIDSQAPNQVVLEWLRAFSFERLKPEYVFRDSRVDFYMERAMELPEAFWEYRETGEDKNARGDINVQGNVRKYLLEVKGCTLERNGIGYFPDAPTERGGKASKGIDKGGTGGLYRYFGFCDCHAQGFRGISERGNSSGIWRSFAGGRTGRSKAAVFALYRDKGRNVDYFLASSLF